MGYRLESYGAEAKLITLVRQIGEKGKSTVRIRNEYGEWFYTDLGTRQGDPLSTFLFITYLDRVMDQLKENVCEVSINGIHINNLRFADDFDLIDHNVNFLQSQIEKTKELSEQTGLLVHTKKTSTDSNT